MNVGSDGEPPNSRRHFTETDALKNRISISTVSVASPHTDEVPPCFR